MNIIVPVFQKIHSLRSDTIHSHLLDRYVQHTLQNIFKLGWFRCKLQGLGSVISGDLEVLFVNFFCVSRQLKVALRLDSVRYKYPTPQWYSWQLYIIIFHLPIWWNYTTISEAIQCHVFYKWVLEIGFYM